MSEKNTLTSDIPDHFPSLASLRAAHGDLLRRRRESGDSPEVWDAAATFIRRGRATGALLDAHEDRRSSQSLLDYWSNIMYRAGQESPEATLAEFRPEWAPSLDDALCPYLGLDAFGEAHRDVFFGRQRLVENMVGRLGKSRLLAVVGSSGSGKSSAVRAGLLPALKAGALLGSQDWRYYPSMVPGSNPLENLAWLLRPADVDTIEWSQYEVERLKQDKNHLVQLIGGSNGRPAVLVVDQFEEIFTLCTDDDVRQAFIDSLLSLVQTPGTRHTVILTMRIDFEPYVARLPSLQPLFEQNQVRVSPLNAGELREAIEGPAKKIGLKFEEGVVDALIQDILGEPAALPLLQFTLLKLWESRQRNRVTWLAYRKLGGARQALAHSADEFYEGLIPEDQQAVKRVLLRMVRPSEGLEVTSNRIRREMLYQAGEARDRVDRVLDRLVQARLVHLAEGETPADAQVEVAHEALVRNWPRLVDWLEDEREAMRQRIRLTAAAEQWAAMDRDPGALLRGTLLREVLHYQDLNELELEFVQASQEEEEAARQRELDDAARQRELEAAQKLAEEKSRSARRLEKRNRIITAVSIVAGVALIVAVIFGYQAYTTAKTNLALKQDAILQRDHAQRQSEIALAQSLTALAPRTNDSVLTTLLALEAYHVNHRVSGPALWLIDSALREVLSQPYFSTVLRTHEDSIASIAYSPDGKRLATCSFDWTVRVWNLEDPDPQAEPLVLEGHKESVLSVAFSPDGRTLASGGGDWTVRLWNLDQPEAEPRVLRGHEDWVRSVAFSPDGGTLASGSYDGTIRLWDPANPAAEPRVLHGHEGGVLSVIFSPDGETLASGGHDRMIRLWNVSALLNTSLDDLEAEPRLLRGHEDSVTSVAFSPDGQTLASGSYDRTARLWPLAEDWNNPRAVPLVLRRHGDSVQSVAFSPEGKKLATGSDDRSVRLWVLTGDQNEPVMDSRPLDGHKSAVWSVAFSPDGGTLASGSHDGTVRLWDLGTPVAEPRFLHGQEGGTSSIALSPNGEMLASGCGDGTIRLWDLSGPAAKPHLLHAHGENVTSVAFNPNGDTLASGSYDETIRLWDLDDLKAEPRLLRGHDGGITSVAFSPDGETLASGGFDGTVRLWNVSALLNTSLDDPTTELHVLRGHQDSVTSVAFSPDGETLASGSYDGTVQLWDPNDPTANPRVLRGQEHWVLTVAFSPDGKTLASAGYDRIIRLWSLAKDPDNPTEEPRLLRGHQEWIRAVAFSPDGETLASGSDDGAVRLWSLTGDLDDTIAEPRVLPEHPDGATSVAFSPDGKTLASGSYDWIIRLWPVSLEELVNLGCQQAGRNLTLEEWERYLPEQAYRKTCEQWP